MKAFEMRYEGCSHEVIGLEIDVNPRTLSTYFSREWKDEFKSYSIERDEYVKKRSFRRLLALNERAITRIDMLLDDNNPKIQLAAARDVLDRSLGKVSNNNIQTGDENYILSILEKYGMGAGQEIESLPTSDDESS